MRRAARAENGFRAAERYTNPEYALIMSHVPTRDLIVAARQLDPHCDHVVSQPKWETCAKDPSGLAIAYRARHAKVLGPTRLRRATRSCADLGPANVNSEVHVATTRG